MCDCAEVQDFLIAEAQRLDGGDLDGWLELLTDDVRYRMPVRSTRYRGGPSEFSDSSFVFDEDMFSLRARAARLHSKFAWAEDPPTSFRHVVTNVSVRPAGEDELDVRSAVLCWRFRADDQAGEFLSADRHDRLRRTEAGLRLSTRTVFTDQAVLTMSTLSTFL